MSYIDSELKKLLPIDEYGISVQLSSTNGTTKKMKITDELLKFISLLNDKSKS